MTIALIVTTIIAATFAFVTYVISLFPNVDVNGAVSVGNTLLKYGLAFLPATCWGVFITTVISFKSFQFAWAIIEWLYKKIPGVD